MSAPNLSPCPCCDTKLAPAHAETPAGQRHFSLGFWVHCPSCEMRGPTTWVSLEVVDVPEEFEAGSRDAARAWNRLSRRAAAGRMLGEVAADINAADGSDRMVSLRGRSA